ncbi:MAG: AEC family transporter [Faecalibacterium sp.]|nr:AEC family transporter [Faecalibacterium sp.]
MQLALITVQQVFSLFLLIAAGYIAAKTGALKPQAKQAFSDLLVNLVLPAMIINTYLSGYDPNTFANLLVAFGLSLLLLGGGMLLAMGLGLAVKGGNRPLVQFAGTFPNAAYMGFPLISALFGAEGLLYASAFATVFNVLQWTAGVALLEPQRSRREMLRGILANPVIWSVVIGLVIYLGRVPVPAILAQPIAAMGSMTTPLSMVITGIIMAGSDLRQMVGNRQVWYVVAMRLLLIPFIWFGVLRLLGLQGMVVQVILLLEASPVAAVTTVMAVRCKLDEKLAAGAVVMSTLLSICTLPLWAVAIPL